VMAIELIGHPRPSWLAPRFWVALPRHADIGSL
jgi:hypothetical protein